MLTKINSQNCLNCKWEPDWNNTDIGKCKYPIPKLPMSVNYLYIEKDRPYYWFADPCDTWGPKEDDKVDFEKALRKLLRTILENPFCYACPIPFALCPISKAEHTQQDCEDSLYKWATEKEKE